MSAEIPAALVAALASGRYDALTGRFLTIADDLEALLQGTAAIDREQLYALRVNRLSTAASARAASRSIADAAAGPAGLTLQLERLLPLPIEEAFAAWIDPAAIARWFIHAADVHWVGGPEVDARPGGGFRSTWPALQGSSSSPVPIARSQSSGGWSSHGAGGHCPSSMVQGDTSVLVEFEGSEGTRVTLVQMHLPHQEALKAHRRGWERCLDGMATLSAG